ncbi:MAG TPA: hypothetical protein VFD52_05825 [Clostridia bacterium]|nr:hypothetical protein [Clostridia bacterium]
MDCSKCKYRQKRYRQKKVAGHIIFTNGYYGCHFLPHWGTDIKNIHACPKIEQNRQESTLKSICKVNTK